MIINYYNLKRMFNNFLLVPEEKINMLYFRTDSEDTHKCESNGCLLGHSVILDSDWDNIPKTHRGTICFVDWGENFTGIKNPTKIWAFLFSGCWLNDKIQILSRLKYFIDNQQIHPDFHYLSENFDDSFSLIINNINLEPYQL